MGITGRKKILHEVAAVFARQRGDTIGAMVLDAGKAITEADTEVSEAIDFANYYAQSLDDPGLMGWNTIPCPRRGGGHAALEFSFCHSSRRLPSRIDGGQ